MLKIVLSANEPSGDRLAAELLRALRAHGPVQARGLCGPAMRAAGVKPVAHLEDSVAMGVVEVLRRLGPIREARARLTEAIAGDCDAFIGVDAPDLHLPLAARARAQGRLAVQWVAPQVWAWRSGRAAKVIRQVDLLLCLFEFEPALFNAVAGPGAGRAAWSGHPLIDRMAGTPVPPAAASPFLALCPGSRPQELERHGARFVAAARALQARRPGLNLVALLPVDVAAPWLPADVARCDDARALRGASAALSKSGTITLELALLGVPTVVAHRVHPLTYLIGRILVNGVQHIALPNILSKAGVLPERVQRWTAGELAALLDGLPSTQPTDLSALGPAGAADRAAAQIWAAARRRGAPADPAPAPGAAKG